MNLDQLWATIADYSQLLLCNDKKLLWEITLVVLSIFAHILDARQNIWSRILTYPILFMNIKVYFVRRLYGKVIYTIISTAFNVYAHIKWRGKPHQQPLYVTRTSNHMLLYAIGTGILGALGFIFIIMMVTDSNKFSFAICGDAFNLSFGLVEKWFMSHKKLERWLIALLRYAAFSIACYHTGASILSIQHLVLVFIGIYGQIKWHRSYKIHKV
ncbi:nicotinamide mononucleotide transporter family protein [Cardinium endosymbiont of Culicoides punctatus]|uniref:nicotinamide mononucleotide transporter family protein n=1 Tax=Cardinium endosymbiont of Culicoides punctatus TaxID=2304601 RepID=UPI001058E166|nr:nicotinamide mononucleotide transporter family protein [Cardinium endosymbiont of Culicoides punctatus]TDG93357.1 hypothetical protein CCPUN_08780 [Cardinium endosymbiont of Culicoides punctatus]